MSIPRFPFPRYPRGWFQVAYSDEVEPGKVLLLKYFGKDLVAFRAESGSLSALDAHCPHLGAHLGHGCSEKPLLCDGDGAIGIFRRWCKTFYPDWYLEEAARAYRAARETGRPETSAGGPSEPS
jgi:hypothetical protein